MKKKFSLWVNLAVICLCVCSIAIGVYAATSATLTVSGQIGFQAHECSVEVSGEIYGHAKDATLTTVYTSTDPAEITMDTDATGIVGGTNATVTNPVSLGTLNFTDLVDPMPSIVVSLTVTNQSPYPVAASVIISDVNNVSYSRKYTQLYKDDSSKDIKDADHDVGVVMTAKDGVQSTVIFTITLNVFDPEKDVTLSDLEITANFAKYAGNATPAQVIDETQGIIYNLNEDKKSYDAMGNIPIDDELGEPVSKVADDIEIAPFVNGLPVTTVNYDLLEGTYGFYYVPPFIILSMLLI